MTLALLCIAQFAVVLDVTIVAVALPAAGSDLGSDPTQLQWVVTAYTVAFSGLLVLGGRVADVVGRRRTFQAGLGLFAAASLACGLAPDLPVLITARTCQGAGAALLAPAALALLTELHPDGVARRRALAWWTAAAAGGGAAGWILGGLVAAGPGWRWIFLVNLPLAVTGGLLAQRRLPVDATSRQRASAGRPRLDVPGAVAATTVLVSLVLALTRFQAGAPTTGVLLLAVAALAAVAFALVERRTDAPLVPLRLAGDRVFGTANLTGAILNAAITPPLLLCVLHLQDVRGRSAIETGLAFAPFNLAVVAGSLAAAPLLRRLGARTTTIAGTLSVAGGCVLILGLPATGSYLPVLLPAFIVLGLGSGLASTAATAAGVGVADGPDQGAAAGVLTATAQAGTAIGLAGLVGLATAVTGAADGVTGIRVAAAAAAGLTLAGALAVVGDRAYPRRETATAVESDRRSVAAAPC